MAEAGALSNRLRGSAMDGLSVNVTPASQAERPVLERLMQFYFYDFSEMEPAASANLEFDNQGGYSPFIHMADYWSRDGFHPLLIRLGPSLVGFGLINTLSHHGGAIERNMAEFFVARKYRRSGVATQALGQILAAYPGRWEVAVVERNTAAKVFWPKAIAAAPNVTNPTVAPGDGEQWRGPIWSFQASD